MRVSDGHLVRIPRGEVKRRWPSGRRIPLKHYFYIQFNGIIDCWRKTIQQNGVLAIYSGMKICLIGDVVYRGLKYTFYDFLKVSNF